MRSKLDHITIRHIVQLVKSILAAIILFVLFVNWASTLSWFLSFSMVDQIESIAGIIGLILGVFLTRRPADMSPLIAHIQFFGCLVTIYPVQAIIALLTSLVVLFTTYLSTMLLNNSGSIYWPLLEFISVRILIISIIPAIIYLFWQVSNWVSAFFGGLIIGLIIAIIYINIHSFIT